MSFFPAVMALFGLLLAASGSFAAPAEPPSYRLDDYNAPVPATLNGKPALGLAEAKVLREGGGLFVDVLPHAPRPEGLAPGTVFVEKPHASIKGAIWLPDVGRGTLAASTEDFFKRALAALTAGDFSKTLVFFCRRDCWMSWNAARRAQSYGYRNVLWFSQGVDGWREAGLPMSELKPWSEPLR